MKLKTIVLVLSIILFGFTTLGAGPVNNAPGFKLYVIINHNDDMHPQCFVVLELKPNSIHCEADNCPGEDIRMLGEGYDAKGNYVGLHWVILKKGYINDDKHWKINAPKTKPKRGNNLWIWET